MFCFAYDVAGVLSFCWIVFFVLCCVVLSFFCPLSLWCLFGIPLCVLSLFSSRVVLFLAFLNIFFHFHLCFIYFSSFHFCLSLSSIGLSYLALPFGFLVLSLDLLGPILSCL